MFRSGSARSSAGPVKGVTQSRNSSVPSSGYTSAAGSRGPTPAEVVSSKAASRRESPRLSINELYSFFEEQDDFALQLVKILSKEKVLAKLHEHKCGLFSRARDLYEREIGNSRGDCSLPRDAQIPVLLEALEEVSSYVSQLQKDQSSAFAEVHSTWNKLTTRSSKFLIPSDLLSLLPSQNTADFPSSKIEFGPLGGTHKKKDSSHHPSANNNAAHPPPSSKAVFDDTGLCVRSFHSPLPPSAIELVATCLDQYYNWTALMTPLFLLTEKLIVCDDKHASEPPSLGRQMRKVSDVQAMMKSLKESYVNSTKRLQRYSQLGEREGISGEGAIVFDRMYEVLSRRVDLLLHRERDLIGATEFLAKEHKKLAEELDDLENKHCKLSRAYQDRETEHSRLVDLLEVLEQEAQNNSERASQLEQERDILAREMLFAAKERERLALEVARVEKERNLLESQLRGVMEAEEDLPDRDYLALVIKEKEILAQQVMEVCEQSDKLAKERDALLDENARVKEHAMRLNAELESRRGRTTSPIVSISSKSLQSVPTETEGEGNNKLLVLNKEKKTLVQRVQVLTEEHQKLMKEAKLSLEESNKRIQLVDVEKTSLADERSVLVRSLEEANKQRSHLASATEQLKSERTVLMDQVRLVEQSMRRMSDQALLDSAQKNAQIEALQQANKLLCDSLEAIGAERDLLTRRLDAKGAQDRSRALDTIRWDLAPMTSSTTESKLDGGYITPATREPTPKSVPASDIKLSSRPASATNIMKPVPLSPTKRHSPSVESLVSNSNSVSPRSNTSAFSNSNSHSQKAASLNSNSNSNSLSGRRSSTPKSNSFGKPPHQQPVISHHLLKLIPNVKLRLLPKNPFLAKSLRT
mmetsp:Transcript_33528/g.54342  ORF Transcript_33528/g.54342 Transcript_33528/m.54342 type:complete len:869 (+) Transcript_33528:185-2791(+)